MWPVKALKLAIVAAVLGWMSDARAQTPANLATPKCDIAVVASGKAAWTRDGRTLVLEDGREVRLAGIEVPPLESSAGAQAKAALQGLISGKMLTFKAAAATHDRYGRLVALAFDGDQSIQNAMLAGGFAQVSSQVYGLAGNCTRELLNLEQQARDNGRGMWSSADAGPLPAAQAQAIAARRGHFALVEGQVLSVRESGSTIYLNFGRRYTRDFSVTILRRNQRVFSAVLGIDPKQLEGRRIRVRGVIEQRGGPIMEASRPEQIELAN
ncbi:MAG: thermonuclease family protein [Pseudolabrys sp.]